MDLKESNSKKLRARLSPISALNLVTKRWQVQVFISLLGVVGSILRNTSGLAQKKHLQRHNLLLNSWQLPFSTWENRIRDVKFKIQNGQFTCIERKDYTYVLTWNLDLFTMFLTVFLCISVNIVLDINAICLTMRSLWNNGQGSRVFTTYFLNLCSRGSYLSSLNSFSYLKNITSHQYKI